MSFMRSSISKRCASAQKPCAIIVRSFVRSFVRFFCMCARIDIMLILSKGNTDVVYILVYKYIRTCIHIFYGGVQPFDMNTLVFNFALQTPVVHARSRNGTEPAEMRFSTENPRSQAQLTADVLLSLFYS